MFLATCSTVWFTTFYTYIWSIALHFCVTILLTPCILSNIVISSRWFSLYYFVYNPLIWYTSLLFLDGSESTKNVSNSSLVFLFYVVYISNFVFMGFQLFFTEWYRHFLTTLYSLSSLGWWLWWTILLSFVNYTSFLYASGVLVLILVILFPKDWRHIVYLLRPLIF